MHGGILFLLIAVVVIYLAIGGALFMVLEQDEEEKFQIGALKILREFYRNKTDCMSESELQQVIHVTVKAHQHGLNIKTNNGSFSQIVNKWDMGGSLFFATTVVSTIGYGNITPKTEGGKIFCIFYGLIGIPLFLVALAATGNKLTEYTGKLAAKMEFCRRRPMAGKALTTCLLMCMGTIIFIILPAGAFSHYEQWSYTDSTYFSFVTLLTIGFGDLVPKSDEDSKGRGVYKVCYSFWFFLGLAWLSTIISSIQEAISLIASKAESAKVGQVCECQKKSCSMNTESTTASTETLQEKTIVKKCSAL